VPKFAQKALVFPLAGVSRRRGYREDSKSYAAPWAVNVWGVAALEARMRGGSRPGTGKVSASVFSGLSGLAPVCYVDGAGTRHNDLIVLTGSLISKIDGTTLDLAAPTVLTLTEVLLATDAGVVISTDAGVDIAFDATL